MFNWIFPTVSSITHSDSTTSTTPTTLSNSSDTRAVVYEEAKRRIQDSHKLREEGNILQDLNISVLNDEDMQSLRDCICAALSKQDLRIFQRDGMGKRNNSGTINVFYGKCESYGSYASRGMGKRRLKKTKKCGCTSTLNLYRNGSIVFTGSHSELCKGKDVVSFIFIL